MLQDDEISAHLLNDRKELSNNDSSRPLSDAAQHAKKKVHPKQKSPVKHKEEKKVAMDEHILDQRPFLENPMEFLNLTSKRHNHRGIGHLLSLAPTYQMTSEL